MAAITAPFGSAISETGKTFKLIARNPASFIGLLVLVVITIVSLVGPMVIPPQNHANVAEILEGPSSRHILGTDFQGSDNLALLVYGGKDILEVAFVAGLLTTLLAVAVGSVSAFLGGIVDTVLMELVNIWLTIPQFPLLAILATMVKLSDIFLLAVLLALLGWAGLARQIRSQVLSLKQRDYVEAAMTLNLGTPHIIFREMLPNMMSFVAISLIFAATSAIYQQTSLVFLGLVPFSSANWGTTLSLAYTKGAIYQSDAAWTMLAPVGAIALFQLALVSLSRSLDEVFNPRLRTSV